MTTERLLPTVLTKPSRAEFAEALLRTWPEATRRGAGVFWAQFALETGEGSHCYNHNLGNVKHVKGDGSDYVSLRGVWEGIKIGDEDGDGDVDAIDRMLLIERLTRSGLWHLDPSESHQVAVGKGKVSMIAEPSNPATWFRAFPSLEAGMQFYVEKKRKPGYRYSSAWKYVLAGDPDAFAYELGRKGYYTADPKVYAAAMRRKFDVWMRDTPSSWPLAAPKVPTPVPTPTPTEPVEVPVVRPDPFHGAIVRPTVPMPRKKGPYDLD